MFRTTLSLAFVTAIAWCAAEIVVADTSKQPWSKHTLAWQGESKQWSHALFKHLGVEQGQVYLIANLTMQGGDAGQVWRLSPMDKPHLAAQVPLARNDMSHTMLDSGFAWWLSSQGDRLWQVPLNGQPARLHTLPNPVPHRNTSSRVMCAGRLFVSGHTPLRLTEYHPGTGQSRSVLPAADPNTSGLTEGMEHTYIKSMVADPQRQQLVLLVSGGAKSQATGVWTLSVVNGELRKIATLPRYTDLFTLNDLRQDRILVAGHNHLMSIPLDGGEPRVIHWVATSRETPFFEKSGVKPLPVTQIDRLLAPVVFVQDWVWSGPGWCRHHPSTGMVVDMNLPDRSARIKNDRQKVRELVALDESNLIAADDKRAWWIQLDSKSQPARRP